MFKAEKTGLFVDGANTFSAAKALGFDVDYARLRNFLEKQCYLITANFYTALLENEYNNIPLHPLVTWLQYNGYNVVTKDARMYNQLQGTPRIKGNMDVEMAVDIMRVADKLEQIILLTGDGDFRYLIEYLQKEGINIVVISTLKTSPPFVADILRKQANEFIELADLRHEITRI